MIAQVEAACAAGGTTVYNTGMTPGFALDLWPITMARTVRRVDAIHVRELVSLRDYKSEMQAFMGFGLRPGDEIPMFKMFEESPDDPSAGALNTPYAGTLHFIGDALGVKIDKVTYTHTEVRTAKECLVLPSGTFEPGTIVGTEFRLSGWADGQEFVTIDFLWRLEDDGWPPNMCAWELEIEGDPTVRSRMEFATETDARRATSLTVAGHCLNAIPNVVAAAPGMLNHITMPIFSGRAAASL
jgi:4-hydroxy-tetrahydrodipicolinate reductase